MDFGCLMWAVKGGRAGSLSFEVRVASGERGVWWGCGVEGFGGRSSKS